LTIFQELGDQARTASAYHQLSTIARRHGRRVEAEIWLARAITISVWTIT